MTTIGDTDLGVSSTFSPPRKVTSSQAFLGAQEAVKTILDTFEKDEQDLGTNDMQVLLLSQRIEKDSLAKMTPEERQMLVVSLQEIRINLNQRGIPSLQIKAFETKVLEFDEGQRTQSGGFLSKIWNRIFGSRVQGSAQTAPMPKTTRIFGLDALVRLFQKRVEKREGEQPVKQEGAVEPSADPLRSFDIPKKKFGITGDSLAPKNVPKNFQKMVEGMRQWGHRRDKDLDRGDSVKKLQHEAKFLGVTEVEYKALLLASGEAPKDTKVKWKKEIDDEQKICDLLKNLNSNFEGEGVSPLLELIGKHPFLGKPEYYALLFTLLQKVSDEEQKKQIVAAMQTIVGAIPSRRLVQFRQEVITRCPGISEKDLFAPGYTVIKEKDVEEAPEQGRHGTIIQLIEADLKLLETLEGHPEALDEVQKGMKSKAAARLLKDEKEETHIDLKDRVALAKKKLQEAMALQKTWKEHPGQALRYFHATNAKNYVKILKGKIAVAGGGAAAFGTPSYSGAFVSKYPLMSYGTIAFGFGEDIEYHARAGQTLPADSGDIWLGFDRAVVPDAQTAQQGDLFRKKLLEDIMKHPQIQKLSPQEKAILEIGLAHVLENDLDVQRTGPATWEAVLTSSDGRELKGAAIISALIIPSSFPRSVERAYKAALGEVGKVQDFGVIKQERDLPVAEQRDAHMRALIVFDDEPSLQWRNARDPEELGYGKIMLREFPKRTEVVTTCRDLGIKIYGENVPIIPWTVAKICSDYDVLFGLGQFGGKDFTRILAPISSSRSFH